MRDTDPPHLVRRHVRQLEEEQEQILEETKNKLIDQWHKKGTIIELQLKIQGREILKNYLNQLHEKITRTIEFCPKIRPFGPEASFYCRKWECCQQKWYLINRYVDKFENVKTQVHEFLYQGFLYQRKLSQVIPDKITFASPSGGVTVLEFQSN